MGYSKINDHDSSSSNVSKISFINKMYLLAILHFRNILLAFITVSSIFKEKIHNFLSLDYLNCRIEFFGEWEFLSGIDTKTERLLIQLRFRMLSRLANNINNLKPNVTLRLLNNFVKYSTNFVSSKSFSFISVFYFLRNRLRIANTNKISKDDSSLFFGLLTNKQCKTFPRTFW